MVTPEQIDHITQHIVKHFQPEKIILFGSYASGIPTEDSDLDLLIVGDSDVPSRVQSRKVRKLASGLGVRLDVIVRTSADFETYRDIIGTMIYPAAQFGKVLYESS